MDCHGRMLAHVLLHESDGILSMSWNYPAFLVEDSSESDTDSDDYSPPQGRVLCGVLGCPGAAGYVQPLPGPSPDVTVFFLLCLSLADWMVCHLLRCAKIGNETVGPSGSLWCFGA